MSTTVRPARLGDEYPISTLLNSLPQMKKTGQYYSTDTVRSRLTQQTKIGEVEYVVATVDGKIVGFSSAYRDRHILKIEFALTKDDQAHKDLQADMLQLHLYRAALQKLSVVFFLQIGLQTFWQEENLRLLGFAGPLATTRGAHKLSDVEYWGLVLHKTDIKRLLCREFSADSVQIVDMADSTKWMDKKTFTPDVTEALVKNRQEALNLRSTLPKSVRS